MRPLPAGPGTVLARFAALGMILGGLFDLTIRSLLPHHEAFLGVDPGTAPAATAALVLLILNTLGVALAAVGALAFTLFEVWRRQGLAWAGWVAALGITVASGLNALAISRVGSLFFLGPALFALLAPLGVAMAERRRSRQESVPAWSGQGRS